MRKSEIKEALKACGLKLLRIGFKAACIIIIMLVICIATIFVLIFGNNYNETKKMDQFCDSFISYELPQKSEVVSAYRLRGSLYGMGANQHYGCILLIKSELSETELEEYYSVENLKKEDYIEDLEIVVSNKEDREHKIFSLATNVRGSLFDDINKQSEENKFDYIVYLIGYAGGRMLERDAIALPMALS